MTTTIEVPQGYERLAKVFQAALNHAACGKGAERHGRDSRGRVLAFDDQPVVRITRVRGLGFPLGQSDKKTEEAALLLARGDRDMAVAELLGSLNYVACAALAIMDGDA